MTRSSRLAGALAIAVLVLGGSGCQGPLYQYRADEVAYVTATAAPGSAEGTPFRPTDHEIEIRYAGAAEVERGDFEFWRLAFDLRIANSGSADIVVELERVRLKDAFGAAWPPVLGEGLGLPISAGPGAEKIGPIAFDLPEDFDFDAHARFEMEIPYRVGLVAYTFRARLVRERVVERVYYRPRPYYYDPWYPPGYYYDPFPFHFSGSFFYHHH